MKKPEIISFDAAGTLIRPYPSVGHVYARHAADFGVKVDAHTLNRNFKNAFKACLQARQGAPLNRELWVSVVNETLEDRIPEHRRPAFFEAVFSAFGRADCWETCPGVDSVLPALKDRRFRMVVLSNNDSRLHQILSGMDLAGFFEQIFVSEAIGVEKPDPRVFSRVVDVLNVPPRSILHVGDSLEADGRGPVRAGWQSVLVPPGKDPEGMIPTLGHLRELPALLS